MKKTMLIVIALLSLSFMIGILVYPGMPDRVASHWDAAGNVNGYMSKFWGVFLMPIITLGIILLLFAIPLLDPLKKNVDKFIKQYHRFIITLSFFMFYIYILTIIWNIGFKFDMIRMLAPAFGILFFYSGVLIQNAKRNWFIGIRTPWTLSSNENWEKTHKLGGPLFKISGIIAAIGILIPSYALAFILAPVIISSVTAIAYSYILYKKKKSDKKSKRNKSNKKKRN